MSQARCLRDALLSTAAVGLALCTIQGAYAQDAETTTEARETADVITVRGIRSSLANSIATKRESSSIVETISAEDIGKLPDVSIAESLARLPGLAAQRVRGRAQVISVRGLGPDYTTALLNGREQVTAGDNRGVEFDQYPAELISQAVVYKTPDAQLVSSGLAGTVDLRTIRPLSYNERLLSVSASYEMNSNDELNDDFDDTGYRFTGTYVDQFANDTLGLVLSFATQNSPTQGEKYEICNFEDRNGAQSPDCFKMFAESRDLERTALMGTLEYEPSDSFNTSLDVLYTDFTDGGVRRGAEFPLGTWLGGGSGLDLIGAQVEDGLVTAGSFAPVFAVGRNDIQEREAELFSIGWNTQWRPFDNWMFEADVSHSRVERSALDFESYVGLGEGAWQAYTGAVDTLSFQHTGDRYRFNSQVGAGYADPNTMLLTDPGGWGQDGFHKTLNTDDQLTALRASATREFESGMFESVEAGLYFTNREKERQTIENFVDIASGAGAIPIPSQYIIGSTSLDYVSNVEVVAYDPAALLNDGVYSLRALPLGFIPQKQWEVEEEVFTAYVQGNIETELLVPVRGNVGFQYIHTDQSSTGPLAFGEDFLIAVGTDGDTYSHFLPSLNLSFELTDNTYLRLGLARTMARARMDDMRASAGVNINSTICPQAPDGSLASYNPTSNAGEVCISGGSGNPQLRPYEADSFDIALEHYFGNGAGYISAAFFHKEINEWVFGSVSRDFDASSVIDEIYGAGTAAANPGIERGRFSAAENVDGGWLRGFELAMNVPGDVLFADFEPLHGFGVFASWSMTDSEIQPPSATQPIAIPGLSEDIVNVTVYYETGGWEFRVSNRYRSDFLAELPDFTGQPDQRSAFEESVVDAQIGYEFLQGPLEGLNVQLQANNLTDERFGTFINGDERQARNWEEYGTTYTLRLSYQY